MKKVMLVLLLVSLPRVVQALPTGCFRADYGVGCHAEYFYASDCNQWNMTSYNFGTYIKSMCDHVNAIESTNTTYLATLLLTQDNLTSCQGSLTAYQNAYNLAASERDDVSARFSAIEQNRQEWISYAGKRDKLIKRLYKACGSKCKRIK